MKMKKKKKKTEYFEKNQNIQKLLFFYKEIKKQFKGRKFDAPDISTSTISSFEKPKLKSCKTIYNDSPTKNIQKCNVCKTNINKTARIRARPLMFQFHFKVSGAKNNMKKIS